MARRNREYKVAKYTKSHTIKKGSWSGAAKIPTACNNRGRSLSVADFFTN